MPAVVDLAAMRDAIAEMGGDPARINPLVPGRARDRPLGAGRRVRHARRVRAQRRARVRAQRASATRSCAGARTRSTNFAVVPPDTGICHQVNLEYLARVVFVDERDGAALAYPDTLVGTDSHTTMVNGLGVLGWGVGGIEAEAAMLGQPMSMLLPQVVGFRLHGALREGATATDLVLTVTEMLRENGVVGQVRRVLRRRPRGAAARRPRDDRQHVARVRLDLRDLPDRRRDAPLPALHRPPAEQIELVEAYAREQGLWHDAGAPRADVLATRSSSTSATVEPSLAGPRRPQDRVPLSEAQRGVPRGARDFMPDATATRRRPATRPSRSPTRPAIRPRTSTATARSRARRAPPSSPRGGTATRCRTTARDGASVTLDGETFELDHGDVVIAAITSCTNTSNPSVMVGAGLLARNAVERGLQRKPWVKTSLAPGSRVVTEYLERAGPDRAARAARLQPRRLRLHDLHRQLRPAAGGGLRRRRRARPRGRRGALGQPQLRGAHPPAT